MELKFEKLNDYGNNKINLWLKILDESSSSKLLAHLNNSDDNFMSFYWEAAVGFLFKKAGFNIEYEKKINNKTPDWFISKNNNNFIVEVVSILETKKVIISINNDETFEPQQKKLEEAIINKKNNAKNFNYPYIIFCVIGAGSSGVICDHMDNILNGNPYSITTDYKKMEGRRADITPELKDENIYCYYCGQYFNDFWSITPFVYNQSKYIFDRELFEKLNSFNGKSDEEIFQL